MQSLKILVVDDLSEFRRLICSVLLPRPEFQVAEASDGLEAVQKASALQPDLIVLDISLPMLNGLEVARRVRNLVPHAKILFCSVEYDTDLVKEALSLGEGYIHKPRLRKDLMPAIDAVLRGKQFLSRTLRDHKFTEANASPDHVLLIYSDEEVLLDSFTRSLSLALKAGNAAIVIATKSHQDDLLHRLRAESVDVDGHDQKGSYVALDVANAFSAIMVNDLPDTIRFYESFEGLMEAVTNAASAEHPRVVVCDEGLGVLWSEGKVDAVIRIEQLSNELARQHPIDMLCAYPASSFHYGAENQAFENLCAEHSAVRFRR